MLFKTLYKSKQRHGRAKICCSAAEVDVATTALLFPSAAPGLLRCGGKLLCEKRHYSIIIQTYCRYKHVASFQAQWHSKTSFARSLNPANKSAVNSGVAS